MKSWLWLWAVVFLGGCAGTDDLRGIAAKPPLDRAVLVSGGAFFSPSVGSLGTFFVGEEGVDSTPSMVPSASVEAIPFASIVDVLERGNVFQRVASDLDTARRGQLRGQLLRSDGDQDLSRFLRQAREDGFDLLVLVEELRDGPIESQGTNTRWPVTFATWILLGVGSLIPDRTFESRATLKVSLRDLQTGRELDNLLLTPGPIELALTERSDFLGFLLSLIVPPFWVGDDRESVADSVRATTQRRLLLSLARDLKSEAVRLRLAEAADADIELMAAPEGSRVVVESRESLSVVDLQGVGYRDAEISQQFADGLLASRSIQGEFFHYEMLLPKASAPGRFQIKVGTLRGGVGSATFTADSAR